MDRVGRTLQAIFVVLLPALGVAWVLRLTDTLGLPLVTQQVIALMIGLAAGAAFLRAPYLGRVTALDIALSLAAAGCWFWYVYNFDTWMVLLAYATPQMWIPGLVALVLMLEALRKSVGLVIAVVVWVVVAYGFFGDVIPGFLRAETFSATKTILYLYADSSGVPGLVVRIIIDLVLPFVIFGKVMEIAGGMTFFTDLALGLMGHRRGGPAKVAVVASGAFGTLSGSTVANVMSTGILTIPMMRRTGFRPAQAAAIEAVASNGGQIMPPVMGATAFIIAEFLQIGYGEVVLAALVPALLYYVVLFLKIDAIAVKEGLAGLPRAQIPPLRRTLRRGWLFVVPLAVLVYLLFWQAWSPGRAALAATAILLVGVLARSRGRPDAARLWRSLVAAGGEIAPLILLGGGAGAVIGIMNSTGFAFQLSLVLTHMGEAYGLFAMLVLAASVSILLGMGMPTAAVYIILVTVVAPTVVDFGVAPLGAHLFLFYFGLMSMITPPIAIGSIVAAQIGNANMWTTSFIGMRLGVSAYLLPFLWIYNPAILLDGTALQIAIVLSNCIGAALLLRLSMMPSLVRTLPSALGATLMMVLALLVGSASLWLGSDNPAAFLPSLVGAGAVWLERRRRPASATGRPQTAM